MKKFFTVISLISFLFFFICKINSQKQNNNMNSLENIFKSLNLKSAGKYKDILVNAQHKPNRVAPEFFIKFVENFKPERMPLSSGISNKKNKLTFYWFSSEFALKGNAKEGIIKINKFLTANKFTAKKPLKNKHGYWEYHFYKKPNDAIDHFLIEGTQDYVGGKEPMFGSTVKYEITYKKNLPQITIEEILKLYPEISCPELPKEIYDYLKDKNFTDIGYGGTWTQYYDWGVSIHYATKKSAEESQKKVIAIISNLGYEFVDNYNEVKSYKNKNNPPAFIYLSIEKGNVFNFRIQPYS